MKKALPLLALLGGAAALVAYKMKKDEQKKIVDLDEGLLYDDTLLENEESNNTSNDDLDNNVQYVAKADDNNVTDIEDKSVNDVVYDEVFKHLTKSEMTLLKEDTEARIASLNEKQDIHEKERPIQHHLKFSNEIQMNEFKNIIINHGYVITRGAQEFELIVLHIAPIDNVKIMANIYYLADVAAMYNGIYKGWETRVTTE